MELAFGQVMLIIGCMAFAENSFAFRNNIRRRRNKPELDSGKRWIFYIRWLVIWELIFGIVTECRAWRNVVDFGNLYLGSASYREEKDNIIEYQEEEKRDDKGKYYLIHCVERYRIKKNEDDIVNVLEEIIDKEFGSRADDYNIRIVDDGIELYKGKGRMAEINFEIGTVFSYIYIDWNCIARYTPSLEYSPIYTK